MPLWREKVCKEFHFRRRIHFDAQNGPRQPTRSRRRLNALVYAQHGRELMGCKLVKLGTHRQVAICTARSRKGYWWLSRTLATQTGMTNAWLTAHGVRSIRQQWINLHYPSVPSTGALS